jgi:uncharacterized protein
MNYKTGFRRHLVIMAKEPRLFRVKTRLGADIGAVKAWTFYRNAYEATLRRLNYDKRWRSWLALSPDFHARKPRQGNRFTVIPQGGGGLGQRMARVFGTLPPGPVVLIGADIPDITPSHIEKAFNALQRHDVVFGPADDGGYWLVGLRRHPYPPERLAGRLFENVRWSGPFSLEDTMMNLERGHKAAFLETLCDIDTGTDFARFRKKAKS